MNDRPEPQFQEGDRVTWEQKPHAVRTVQDEPMWSEPWREWTSWLGGMCRLPECQLNNANGPATLKELKAATAAHPATN